MIGITMLITAFIPFFSQLAKNISVISLSFGQVALIFLFILVAFPRANYKHIIELSTAYILFLGSCFVLLSFLPLDPTNKIFGWQSLPALVLVDIPSLIFINVLSFIYMNLGFYIYKPVSSNATAIHPSTVENTNYQEEFKENLIKTYTETSLIKTLETEVKDFNSMDEVKSELRKEVNSLFSVYLDDNEDTESGGLNDIEEILVKHLDPSVEEALCMDSEGRVLNNTVFRWKGASPQEILDLFEKHTLSSQNLNTGRLCQVLVSSQDSWHIIAKYKNNFLVLKTGLKDPSPLLNTSFKVFKAISAHAKAKA